MQLRFLVLGMSRRRAGQIVMDQLRRLVIAGVLSGAASAANAGPVENHQAAVDALADVRAAIEEIQGTAPMVDAGLDSLVRARRAIDDLVGSSDSRYTGAGSDGGSMTGALVYLDQVFADDAHAPWAPAIAHAQGHVRAAVKHLQEAVAEDRAEAYQRDVIAALADLETAVGRASELGVRGGISGALATTVLGVPAGATTVSACDIPRDVPSYGVAAGYLVFVALPAHQGETRLPIDLGSTLLVATADYLVIYTAAETLRPTLCGPIRDGLAPDAAATTVAAASRVN